MKNSKLLMLTECSVMLALSIVLSFVKVWKMPMGGAVTLLSMLPIMLISVKYGLKGGLPCGLLYALFNLLMGVASGDVFVYCTTGAMVVICVLFDYLVPFTVLGCAAMFRKPAERMRLNEKFNSKEIVVDRINLDEMFFIAKRQIGKAIILSIVTFGIYYIYWKYLLVKNTKSLKKDNTGCVGEWLCLVLIPFYSLYWWYTRGELIRNEFDKHGCFASEKGIAELILCLFGLEIVSVAIMQNDFNSLPSEGKEVIRVISRKADALLLAGFVLVIVARFACHYITGFSIWGQWAPEGQSKYIYSLIYNGQYMLPECIFTTIGAAVLINIPVIRKQLGIRDK